MKILVHNSNYLSEEMCQKLNIHIDYLPDSEDAIISFPNEAKVLEDVIVKDKIKNWKFDYLPELTSYIASDDNSLADFVIVGRRICATGDLQKSDNPQYDFACMGSIRFYDDPELFTTTNFILSSETALEEHCAYLNSMLQATNYNFGITPKGKL